MSKQTTKKATPAQELNMLHLYWMVTEQSKNYCKCKKKSTNNKIEHLLILYVCTRFVHAVSEKTLCVLELRIWD